MYQVASVQVPFNELDAAGVLYHAHYFSLCERARNQWFDDIGLSYFELEKRDLVLPVVRIESDFFKVVGYERLQVVTQILTVERSLIRLNNIVYGEVDSMDEKAFRDRDLAKQSGCRFFASYTMVMCSLSKLKPLRVPEDLRQKLGGQ